MTTHPPTFIHLGLPKTATTCLQTNLFANHSQIHFFGKFSGGGTPSKTRPILRSILNGVTLGDIDQDLHKKIKSQLAYASQNHLIPVLSQEKLARENAEKKQKQAELFSNHFGSCRIILCVREPISYIKSYYTQNLKSFHRRWRRPRPAWMAKMGTAPHYFDINEWMSVCWDDPGSPCHTLAYADTAAIYANVFGKNQVKILLFEEFVRNPPQFIRQLCDYLQINAEEGVNLIHNKRANEGITTEYIEQIKSIEKSSVKTALFRNSTNLIRLKLLNPETKLGEKFKPELSAENINSFSREQNQRLVHDWGISIADYGYQL
jgi:hypothetical protein